LTRLAASSAVAATLIAVLGCQKREPPESVLARSTAEFRSRQIESLEALIAQAEKGELVTTDQIALGISEDAARTFLNASLPQEAVVAERLRVRLESAEPVFRGNKAALLIRGRASMVAAPGAYVTIELGGDLGEFKLDSGTLSTRVTFGYFRVHESSLGDLAADALESLVRAHTDIVEAVIPPVQIPVQLEESIRIGGLTEGAVVARPGALPLNISVSQVIPLNQRLWVLLEAKAGPWQPASTPETGTAPADK
jgi:hypothetical protein